MEQNLHLKDLLHKALAPKEVWQFQEKVSSLVWDLLTHLPKEEVPERERRYPTTPGGLRAFVEAFFARHYFQLQDTFLEYFSSPSFLAIARRGSMQIADIGSGPSVGTMAIMNMASVALNLLKNELGQPSSLVVNAILNDTSEICLDAGRSLLDRYGRSGLANVRLGRVVPVSTPFPKSLMQLRRLAGMTTPFDVCCLGYVMVPLSEQIGVRAAAEAIRSLAQAASQDGCLVLTQDKFREDLHRRLARGLGVSTEMAELKQQVYDRQNENDQQTYLYCRSCIAVSELQPAGAEANVA